MNRTNSRLDRDTGRALGPSGGPSSTPDRLTRRRAIIAVGGVAVPTVLAGCSNGITGPDPVVEESEMEQDFFDRIGGSGTVRVTIINEGSAGDVMVTVRVLDADGVTLDRAVRVVYMDEGERRRVDVEVNVPDGAETFTEEVEAA